MENLLVCSCSIKISDIKAFRSICTAHKKMTSRKFTKKKNYRNLMGHLYSAQVFGKNTKKASSN